LARELAALVEVKHQNVIGINGMFKANNNIYTFMEPDSSGRVIRHIEKNKALKESLACH